MQQCICDRALKKSMHGYNSKPCIYTNSLGFWVGLQVCWDLGKVCRAGISACTYINSWAHAFLSTTGENVPFPSAKQIWKRYRFLIEKMHECVLNGFFTIGQIIIAGNFLDYCFDVTGYVPVRACNKCTVCNLNISTQVTYLLLSSFGNSMKTRTELA